MVKAVTIEGGDLPDWFTQIKPTFVQKKAKNSTELVANIENLSIVQIVVKPVTGNPIDIYIYESDDGQDWVELEDLRETGVTFYHRGFLNAAKWVKVVTSGPADIWIFATS